MRKQEFFIPVLLVLRALSDNASDKDIFERIAAGNEENTFLTDRIELLLRSNDAVGIRTRSECLEYIGSKFHILLDSPPNSTQESVGKDLLKKFA